MMTDPQWEDLTPEYDIIMYPKLRTDLRRANGWAWVRAILAGLLVFWVIEMIGGADPHEQVPGSPAASPVQPVTRPEPKEAVRMAAPSAPNRAKPERLTVDLTVPKVIPPAQVAWPVERAAPKDLRFPVEKKPGAKKAGAPPKPHPQPGKKNRGTRGVTAPVRARKPAALPTREARPRPIYQHPAGSLIYQESMGTPGLALAEAEQELLRRGGPDQVLQQALSSEQEYRRCLEDPVCRLAVEIIATEPYH